LPSQIIQHRGTKFGDEYTEVFNGELGWTVRLLEPRSQEIGSRIHHDRPDPYWLAAQTIE